jgi:uncharacterized protein
MKQSFRLIILLLASFIVFIYFDQEASAADKKDKNKATEVKIRMNDGVELATDLYLPKGKGKFPAVIIRTPYNKSSDAGTAKGFKMFGIAVVVQDVRGKNGSGGEFYPFVNERSDGLQTLRWIREQPWSNGLVAGWGGSYVGTTQWAICDSLDFMTPLLTGASLYDFVYPESLFSFHTAFLWGVINASSTANNIPVEKLKAIPMILPLSVADDSTIKDIPYLDDWLQHERYDDYWKTMNYRGLKTPPLISIAGWYDIFLKAQIEDFQSIEKRGKTENRIIIGPWCHGNQGEKNDYGGVKKTGKPTKIFMYAKNYLKGKDPKLASPLKDTKYNLFIMERNEYIGSDVWPPKETAFIPYYIGPGAYLGTSTYKQKGALEYIYSPSDPFPSIGGTILGVDVGPARQNSNADRKDQLVFEMPVNEKPLTLLGPVSATLWVSSDAECTDFIVGLQDVFPDGKIINIQEGGARVKFTGAQPQKTEVSVWATGYQLNKGHKLRVFISSSWFPRYNRNLNNCKPAFTGKEMVNASQKVYYSDEMPSSINLPIFEK